MRGREALFRARWALVTLVAAFVLASCGSSGDVATDDGDDLAQILQALEEAEAAEQSQVQSEGEVVPAESTGTTVAEEVERTTNTVPEDLTWGEWLLIQTQDLMAEVAAGPNDDRLDEILAHDCRNPAGREYALRAVGDPTFVPDTIVIVNGRSPNSFDVWPHGRDGYRLEWRIEDDFGARATLGFSYDSETRNTYLFAGRTACPDEERQPLGADRQDIETTISGYLAAMESGDWVAAFEYFRVPQCSDAGMRDWLQETSALEQQQALHPEDWELVEVSPTHYLRVSTLLVEEDGRPSLIDQWRLSEDAFGTFDGWYSSNCIGGQVQ